MSNNILDKVLTLKLNANWQPVGVRSVRDAITDLTSEGAHGRKPALALDVTYARNEDGSLNYDDFIEAPRAVEWDEWITLPVREEDLFIESTRGHIRVPNILVARHFRDMPMRRFRPSRRAVYERDRGICQATGRPVGWNQGNLDHLYTPKSRGGRDTFENTAWMDKELNTLKGDKSFKETAALILSRKALLSKTSPHLVRWATNFQNGGEALIRKAVAPKDMPISMTFKEVKHPSWKLFLHSK